jgi:hypothetical protein
MNAGLLELLMGVETPIPPKMINAAAPKGAPWRPQLPDFLETVFPPPCPARGPEVGSAHINFKYITDFHRSGVELSGIMPVSPEKKMKKKLSAFSGSNEE